MMSPKPDPPSSALLRTAYNVLAGRIFESVVTGGDFDDLRPSHGNAMEQLEFEDGVRLTDLAARAGITAQSMGELIDDLEANGYVERQPDPEDGRAKRIFLTARGRANIRVAARATAEVESDLAELLGEDRYEVLRDVLTEIIAAGSGDDGEG